MTPLLSTLRISVPPCLVFLICKISMTIVPNSYNFMKIKRVNLYQCLAHRNHLIKVGYYLLLLLWLIIIINLLFNIIHVSIICGLIRSDCKMVDWRVTAPAITETCFGGREKRIDVNNYKYWNEVTMRLLNGIFSWAVVNNSRMVGLWKQI